MYLFCLINFHFSQTPRLSLSSFCSFVSFSSDDTRSSVTSSNLLVEFHSPPTRSTRSLSFVLHNSDSMREYGCLCDSDEIDGFSLLYNDSEAWIPVSVASKFSFPFAKLQQRTHDLAPSRSSRTCELRRRKSAVG